MKWACDIREKSGDRAKAEGREHSLRLLEEMAGFSQRFAAVKTGRTIQAANDVSQKVDHGGFSCVGSSQPLQRALL